MRWVSRRGGEAARRRGQPGWSSGHLPGVNRHQWDVSANFMSCVPPFRLWFISREPCWIKVLKTWSTLKCLKRFLNALSVLYCLKSSNKVFKCAICTGILQFGYFYYVLQSVTTRRRRPTTTFQILDRDAHSKNVSYHLAYGTCTPFCKQRCHAKKSADITNSLYMPSTCTILITHAVYEWMCEEKKWPWKSILLYSLGK